MALSEFEKQQIEIARESLAIQRAQVAATEANTKALERLSNPPQDGALERQTKVMGELRKGNRPADVIGEFSGEGAFSGKDGENTPLVRFRTREALNGPRAGVITEANFTPESRDLLVAHLTARFKNEHAGEELEAERGGPAARDHLAQKREKWIGQHYWSDCMKPMLHAVIGRTRAETSHFRWSAEPLVQTGAAPPAPSPEPAPIEVKPAPPVLDSVEKRAGVLSDAKPGNAAPYGGMLG